MAIQGSIAFLTGIDRHGAQPPAGFPFRFAVLTWFEEDGSMTEPWGFFRRTLPEVASASQASDILAEYAATRQRGWFGWCRKRQPARKIPWAELMRKHDRELDETGGFPDRVRFLRNGEDVLIAISEMWSSAGGPAPYHDSVTLSFFGREELAGMLRPLFIRAAEDLGIVVRQVSSPQSRFPLAP